MDDIRDRHEWERGGGGEAAGSGGDDKGAMRQEGTPDGEADGGVEGVGAGGVLRQHDGGEGADDTVGHCEDGESDLQPGAAHYHYLPESHSLLHILTFRNYSSIFWCGVCSSYTREFPKVCTYGSSFHESVTEILF